MQTGEETASDTITEILPLARKEGYHRHIAHWKIPTKTIREWMLKIALRCSSVH
jgi:hypothetical protein